MTIERPTPGEEVDADRGRSDGGGEAEDTLELVPQPPTGRLRIAALTG